MLPLPPPRFPYWPDILQLSAEPAPARHLLRIFRPHTSSVETGEDHFLEINFQSFQAGLLAYELISLRSPGVQPMCIHVHVCTFQTLCECVHVCVQLGELWGSDQLHVHVHVYVHAHVLC